MFVYTNLKTGDIFDSFQIFLSVVFRESCAKFGVNMWRYLSCETASLSSPCTVRFFCRLILYCPAVFGHFSPAPMKTNRAVRIQ